MPCLNTASGEPDIIIREGELNYQGEVLENGYGIFFTDDYVQLYFELVGCIEIRDASEIIADLDKLNPELAFEDLMHLGKIWGILLLLRKVFVLHASSVSVDGQGIAFCASGGTGKSTSTALCYKQGCTVLADDATAIDINENGSTIRPSFAQLNLWPRSIEGLGEETTRFIPLQTNEEKLKYPVSRLAEEPVPLKRIYILCKEDCEDWQINPADPFLIFRSMTWHSFIAHLNLSYPALDLLELSGLKALHFQQCADLQKELSIKLLIRPESSFDGQALMALIRADLQE